MTLLFAVLLQLLPAHPQTQELRIPPAKRAVVQVTPVELSPAQAPRTLTARITTSTAISIRLETTLKP
jgi:hypothetical protein